MSGADNLRVVDELPRAVDCVVIGGGILGAATAFSTQRAGLATLLVERRSALATLTTAAATGGFRAQFDDPDEMALARESIAVFERFADEIGIAGYDIGFQRRGYLWVTTDGATARRQRDLVARQRVWGLDDVELIEGVELRRRFPYLAPAVVAGRFRAADGFMAPPAIAIGYARAAGAAIAPATEVVGITVRGNRVVAVRTDRGEVACANAVLCAGPFSVALAQTVGIRLPIELRIRRRLIFPDLAEVPPDAPMTIDDDSGAHWRPAGRGAFVLFAEPAAAPGPALDPVPAAADFYETVMAPNGPAAVARTTPFWRRVWERGSDPWTVVAGQYSYTPDGHPLLGATPIAGLFVNCGDNGHGAMCSPARARIVAESILGSLRPAANPFRLDRPLAPARTDRL